ncbi:hypothetical protein GCM10011357_36970 [Lacimicrobium alkaliphilum]|uniref:DUF4236 domain-containing protein n=1 Tax=Lacimicrobium alkaliphilum TaxID=1526571 RepID=A0ABQ1RR38_9ALTE|nr:hypothetical protein GCM10011357_36970 [Lacimicrobium alkaliphilum]
MSFGMLSNTVKTLGSRNLSLRSRAHNQAIKFAPFGRRTSFHPAVYGGRYVRTIYRQ